MQLLNIDNKTISKPVLEIIYDIQNRLRNGKLQLIKVRNDNIRVQCPFHSNGLEKRPSADIYIGDSTDSVEYGHFHCFACGESHPFYVFVASCFNSSIDYAKQWLIDNYADGNIEATLDLPEIDLTPKKIKNNTLDEAILSTFESFSPYAAAERRISKEILDAFEVKYDPKTQCVVFPVRDEFGKLVMLTKRSVNSKMFFIDEDKEKPLYLLHYLLKNNIQKAMICESQIDALQAYSYGFPCVATIGSLSDHQIDLINKSCIRVLYICFDNDIAGRRFTNKLLKNIRKDIFVINVPILISGKKDINDLTREEFYSCVEHAETHY